MTAQNDASNNLSNEITPRSQADDLLMSKGARRVRRLAALTIHTLLLLVTSSSAIAVIFIFIFIAKDAIPFFQLRGFTEFFTTSKWYPSHVPPSFGSLAIFVGSGLVTIGSVFVAVPIGVIAAVCLSDVLPFSVRQVVKPIVEILAAIPSVAYGFFALVVLAPLLQEYGGRGLAVVACILIAPVLALTVVIVGDLISSRVPPRVRKHVRVVTTIMLGLFSLLILRNIWTALDPIVISTGTNALNVSLILGIMALPTIVSVSEDSLQAVGRELREGSYAMGATRAETITKVVLPAAGSGICAAVILGFMRAIGETMVVWMASGNAAKIPEPWYNFLEPVRTLTATIAGDMGEADHITGSERYHVLFAMALCLLVISFVLNLVSEWAVRRTRKRMRGA